ncbi:unnamed protein product [Malus baccata var. baccata]
MAIMAPRLILEPTFTKIQFISVYKDSWLLRRSVYVDQPLGFVIEGKEDKVHKLKNALSLSEATLYIKATEVRILIVSLYVDDIIYTGSSSALMDDFKADIMRKYEMSDLGLLHHFLGLRVIQTERCIFLHQKEYAKTLLEKFGLKDCKPVATSLAANEKLSKEHGSEMANESLYRQMVGTEDNMKRTSRYAFSFGSGAFSWVSIKQSSVALSTAEAKYVSVVDATA